MKEKDDIKGMVVPGLSTSSEKENKYESSKSSEIPEGAPLESEQKSSSSGDDSKLLRCKPVIDFSTYDDLPEQNNKKRNVAILFFSTSASILLFSPARDFGNIAISYIMADKVSRSSTELFSFFCGLTSVSARIIIGFNAWDKIFTMPEKSWKKFGERFLFYISGLLTTTPLAIDNFQLNKSEGIFYNIFFTFLPPIFMAGVYGQATEFMFYELKGKNEIENKNAGEAEKEKFKKYKRMALGTGVFLGSISGFGSYWKVLDAMTSLTQSFIKQPSIKYILSSFPVICHTPLFIKSTYTITNKSLNFLSQSKLPSSFKRTLLLVFAALISLLAAFSYSDVVYNGMTGSDFYNDFSAFRNYLFPTVLGISMFSTFLVNLDGVIQAGERTYTYFSKSKLEPLSDEPDSIPSSVYQGNSESLSPSSSYTPRFIIQFPTTKDRYSSSPSSLPSSSSQSNYSPTRIGQP